ncbi:hypothetical protein F7725_004703 [Dissostichus mawsoni]|uniref:Ig-like domain-containing protein n=1 Tax=Dissostichus mawsoni TaxID=36200 RepID=A0A7J5XKZ2_DISMA|nr:hypothetical protein F7725_004703 [Dissostichus mawsoni]
MLVSMKQSKAPKNLQMVQYNEYTDVTYSVVELKNISKKGKKNESEDCVYSHVQMASAAAGKSSPAPADETVYSELKPGTALGKDAASNNVFCKDKTNGNNIPKLNLCLLNLICSFALHSSDSILYNNPKPALKVSRSWLSPGASVTLNCSVTDTAAGWRFYWYKAVANLSINSNYSYELLPGKSNRTENNIYIVNGQTHTAGYVCRAGRGNPVHYSWYSKPKFVWSGDSHAPSVKVSPDRVQHFSSEPVSLSCEGNQWRVVRFTEAGHLSNCSDWGRKNGSTWIIKNLTNKTAVYWCEFASGEFSNAVNITIQSDIILVSPVHPVTEGDSVRLSCKVKSGSLSSNVYFYRNNTLQNDTSAELRMSAVSKSDEGFYMCQDAEKNSIQSWKNAGTNHWVGLWDCCVHSPAAILWLHEVQRCKLCKVGTSLLNLKAVLI